MTEQRFLHLFPHAAKRMEPWQRLTVMANVEFAGITPSIIRFVANVPLSLLATCSPLCEFRYQVTAPTPADYRGTSLIRNYDPLHGYLAHKKPDPTVGGWRYPECGSVDVSLLPAARNLIPKR